MHRSYATLQQQATAEYVLKKSRFITYASPIQTEEQFAYWLSDIKKQHPLAHHHCYAYVIGERDELQKQSDDGEPSGTAGKPILEVIKQQALKYTAIVVVRYFGGIQLGTGGLARAYTESCRIGINAAQKIFRVLHQQVNIIVDFAWYGKLQHIFLAKGIRIGEIAFADYVIIETFPLAHEIEQWCKFMQDLTHGQCKMTVLEEMYLSHAHNPDETNA